MIASISGGARLLSLFSDNVRHVLSSLRAHYHYTRCFISIVRGAAFVFSFQLLILFFRQDVLAMFVFNLAYPFPLVFFSASFLRSFSSHFRRFAPLYCYLESRGGRGGGSVPPWS